MHRLLSASPGSFLSASPGSFGRNGHLIGDGAPCQNQPRHLLWRTETVPRCLGNREP